MKENWALGFDLGLRNGGLSIYRGENGILSKAYQFGGTLSLELPKILILSSFLFVEYRRMSLLARSEGVSFSAVLIDWDPNDAFWGTRRMSVLKGSVVSLLNYRLIKEERLLVEALSPARVRKLLGLKSREGKETVWEAAALRMSEVARRSFHGLSPDEKDAAVLSLLWTDLQDPGDE